MVVGICEIKAGYGTHQREGEKKKKKGGGDYFWPLCTGPFALACLHMVVRDLTTHHPYLRSF